jgi:hypothetical protein
MAINEFELREGESEEQCLGRMLDVLLTDIRDASDGLRDTPAGARISMLQQRFSQAWETLFWMDGKHALSAKHALSGIVQTRQLRDEDLPQIADSLMDVFMGLPSDEPPEVHVDSDTLYDKFTSVVTGIEDFLRLRRQNNSSSAERDNDAVEMSRVEMQTRLRSFSQLIAGDKPAFSALKREVKDALARSSMSDEDLNGLLDALKAEEWVLSLDEDLLS